MQSSKQKKDLAVKITSWFMVFSILLFDPASSLAIERMFNVSHASLSVVEWASVIRGFSEGSREQVWSVAVDSNDDIVAAGQFDSLVDFNPGPGYDERDGNNTPFLTKLHSDRSYGWTKTFEGTGIISKIFIDHENHIIGVGSFSGTFDFDPDVREYLMTSNGGVSNDNFIVKFFPDGSLEWVRTFGSPLGLESVRDLFVDDEGNIYVSGWFTSSPENPIDFDPSDGVDIHFSNGLYDGYVMKLKPDGSYDWTKTVGGTGLDWIEAVTVDYDQNVYYTGTFNGTVDFDPSPSGVYLLASHEQTDVFVSKLDKEGNFEFTYSIGGNEIEEVTDIATGIDGDLFILGAFSSLQIDFNPHFEGSDYLEPKGNYDLFLTKMKFDGSYAWTKVLSGESDDRGANQLTVDPDGNVIIAGGFWKLIDFDPSGNGVYRDAGTTHDIYAVQISPEGVYQRLIVFPTNGSYPGRSITSAATCAALDSRGALVLGGYFIFPVVLGGILYLPSGYEGFVLKLDPSWAGLSAGHSTSDRG